MSNFDSKTKPSIFGDGSHTGKIRVERLGKGKLKITADVVKAEDILQNLDGKQMNSVTLDLGSLLGSEENRGQNRVAYWGPVVVHEFNGDTCWAGQAKNISRHGLQLELTSESLDVGQQVVVEFLGTNNLQPFGAKCEIVYIDWNYENSERHHANVGFKIIDIDDVSKQILETYLKTKKSRAESHAFSDLLDIRKVIGEK